MKKFFFLLAACALIATSCDNTQKEPNQKDTSKFSINTIKVEDSIPFPPEAREEGVVENLALYSAEVDAPVTENEVLRNSITSWISSLLNEDYIGDSQDVKAMVEFDKKAFFEENEEDMEMYQSSVAHSIKMVEDNDRFVTYCCENWFYMGGAHGITYVEGATFNKATGKCFSYKMFKNPAQIREMIKTILQKQYFEPMLEETDMTFEDAVYSEIAEAFPLPETNPWIHNDSVFFIYQDDEIAAHAFGLPTCGVPYETLKDQLTEEGMTFFNK